MSSTPVFFLPNSPPNHIQQDDTPSARIITAMQFVSMMHRKQSPKVVPGKLEGHAEVIDGGELSVYEHDTFSAALKTLEDYFNGKLKVSTYEKQPEEDRNPFDGYVLKTADCPFCVPRPNRGCPYCKGSGTFTILEAK